ncbi:MAG: class I SAM-dependent methyltransferase [Candidatus Giovannonibacteria bacterium]|nr:MAG: class I SAM-dependent methyltransferase [Candidatus Giovannonibacteria bacterium]
MTKSKKQWWKTLFDEKYLKTYIDTVTPELTKRQIPFLLKRLQLKKGAEILDLACGHGRHAIELAKRGYKVTGLDFSKHFIDIAKKDANEKGVKVNFIQGDMRNLSFVNKFDAIINIFTSFGYFDDESDNELVLRKISRALKPNGKFLIEINNAMGKLARMSQEGKTDKKTGFLTNVKKDKLSNSLIVTTKDEFNPATMRWSMTRTWKEKGRLKIYKTNVRMFSPPELNNMMKRNDLRIEKTWGDLQGSPFGFAARRLVVLARKS